MYYVFLIRIIVEKHVLLAFLGHRYHSLVQLLFVFLLVLLVKRLTLEFYLKLGFVAFFSFHNWFLFVEWALQHLLYPLFQSFLSLQQHAILSILVNLMVIQTILFFLILSNLLTHFYFLPFHLFYLNLLKPNHHIINLSIYNNETIKKTFFLDQ